MRPALLFSLSLVVACTSEPSKSSPPAPLKPVYPAAWFAPLPPDVKPHGWEITPDKAGPGEVILSKRTELGVFSNFAATPFELDGKRYASLEGFWQAMYYPDGPDDPRAQLAGWKHTRAEVEQLTAFEAKEAGNDAKKRCHAAGVRWISYGGKRFEPEGSAEDQKLHLEIVERATRAKIDQNPEVKKLLLATGDLVFRPDHHQGKDATPAHRYFEILMRIRDDLSRQH